METDFEAVEDGFSHIVKFSDFAGGPGALLDDPKIKRLKNRGCPYFGVWHHSVSENIGLEE